MRTSVQAGAEITLAEGRTERDAQLLVCGAYPDKQLTVREQDLDDIVAAFSDGTVPIKVEHVDSPLDPLGTVRRVWREGTRLLGTIGFDAAVLPFLAKRPVGRLSVGLDRDRDTQKLRLAEVSLVLKPRLATAALLGEEEAPRSQPAPQPCSPLPRLCEQAPITGGQEGAEGGAEREIGRLRAELAARDVETRLGELRRGGHVVPAIEPLARALLSAGEGAARVTLSDGATMSVADTAWRLLQALPRLVTFGETAPGRGAEADDEPLPELTPAQAAYCRDVLRVDPDRVRAAMGETIARKGE